jgi:hypothetical protein
MTPFREDLKARARLFNEPECTMKRRTKNYVTLAALLAGWAVAVAARAQTIQSPFAGNRPFAPSAPVVPPGQAPDQRAPTPAAGRPFAPSPPQVPYGRGPDSMRDPLIRDIVKWLYGGIDAASVDEERCRDRRSSYRRLKIIHDAYVPFVQNGVIPPGERQAAYDAGARAAIGFTQYVDMSLSDISDGDQAACCRTIARGGRVSGQMRDLCPGEIPDPPPGPWRGLGWHRPN